MVPKAWMWDVLEHQNTLMSKLGEAVPMIVRLPRCGMYFTLLAGVSLGSTAQTGMLLAPPPDPDVRQNARSESVHELTPHNSLWFSDVALSG